MSEMSFYRAVETQISQGDIFASPSHSSERATCLLHKAHFPRKKQGFEAEEVPDGTLPNTPREGALVPATCHVTRAMLLTHSCELDKDTKHRLVALIRPLPAVWNDENKTIVKEGGTSLFFTFRLVARSYLRVMSISVGSVRFHHDG